MESVHDVCVCVGTTQMPSSLMRNQMMGAGQRRRHQRQRRGRLPPSQLPQQKGKGKRLAVGMHYGYVCTVCVSRSANAHTHTHTHTQGGKAKKDPNAPKRPSTAFFIWLNENRPSIKAQDPGLSVTEVGKKAGELWKKLSDKSVSRHGNE